MNKCSLYTSVTREINENTIINIEQDENYLFNESPSIGNKLMSRKLIGDLKFKENKMKNSINLSDKNINNGL